MDKAILLKLCPPPDISLYQLISAGELVLELYRTIQNGQVHPASLQSLHLLKIQDKTLSKPNNGVFN